MEPIDESVERKRKLDHTLARFSAVHDEIAEEERRRRSGVGRFMPWRAVDEEMEQALSSTSLPVVAPPPPEQDAAPEPEQPQGQPVTRLQAKKLRKHNRARLAGKIIAVVVAILIFGVTGVAWGAKAWVNSKFQLIDALNENSAAIRNAAGQQGDQNFLLVGSDTRIGESSADNAGTVKDAGGARADTVMVAHIPADRKRVIVVSFPRDLEVARPSCQRWNPKTGQYSTTRSPPQPQVKLNSVYSVGGPKCLTDMVQSLSGLKINHFAGIDFGGFKDMVDAVGGVQVCTTKPLKDTVLGTVLPRSGKQSISGTQALNYVRARHVIGDPTSDYGRMQRQQRFLSSLLRKVLSHDVLLAPGKLSNFINAFAKSTFGQNLDVDQLLTLAQSMQGISSGKVTFVTVPTTGYANSRGNEVLRTADNRALFDSIINGTALPGAKPAPSPQAQSKPTPTKVDPKRVKIQVLNAGNTTNGIAKGTADTLAKQGFQVMQTQNAPSKVAHTTIKYAADAADRAKVLAAAVPGATLQQDPSAEGAVILLIGPEFHSINAGTSGDSGNQNDSGTKQHGPPLATVNAADTSCT